MRKSIIRSFLSLLIVFVATNSLNAEQIDSTIYDIEPQHFILKKANSGLDKLKYFGGLGKRT